MVSSVLSDLRYALRQMRRTPVLTVTAVLTLGLGIGATTAVFSLIYAVMLKSLPVEDPGALYRIGTGKICCYSGNPEGEWGIFSYDFYQRLRSAAAPEQHRHKQHRQHDREVQQSSEVNAAVLSVPGHQPEGSAIRNRVVVI